MLQHAECQCTSRRRSCGPPRWIHGPGTGAAYARRVPRGGVPAARSALAVLQVLARSPGPVPAATLARELGLPRSSTYHLLTELIDAGFVVHLPEERRYGLGVERVRDRQRLLPAGAAGPPRPPAAGPAGRRGRALGPPGGAARPRGALRRRAAGARPAAAGHRRRRPAARAADRERPRAAGRPARRPGPRPVPGRRRVRRPARRRPAEALGAAPAARRGARGPGTPPRTARSRPASRPWPPRCTTTPGGRRPGSPSPSPAEDVEPAARGELAVRVSRAAAELTRRINGRPPQRLGSQTGSTAERLGTGRRRVCR